MSLYPKLFGFNKNQEVLVIGDVMLDCYWSGSTSRISPEAPVPVVKVNHTEDRPGGAANVAVNLGSLNCPTKILTITGNDDAASKLKTLLESASVQCFFYADKSYATTKKLRIVSQRQQMIRLDFENKICPNHLDRLEKKALELLKNANVCLISDYGKGVASKPVNIIRYARSKNIPVFIDPKGTDFSKYAGATLLTPNLLEFETIVGQCHDETMLREKAYEMINQLNLEGLLITRNAQGMTLFMKNIQPIHFPAKAKEVCDVTGAGDTVIATLAAGINSGKTFAESAYYANIAAGIVVGKLGSAAIGIPELSIAISSMQTNRNSGCVTTEQLLTEVNRSRQHGKSIVLTNGCFDVLNLGHVEFLKKAKSYGDLLIVAVNTDDSATLVKNNASPVNSLERRMGVISELKGVDWVVSFSETTADKLLSLCKPDVFVKGNNCSTGKIIERDVVESYGGKVIMLDVEHDLEIIQKEKTKVLMN